MGKKLSCGILVVDPKKQTMLVGHPTGNLGFWDLFKGGIDSGESVEECAIRELMEESGINADIGKLRDLGRHDYTPKKDLHLFELIKHENETNFENLICTSMIEPKDGNTPFPEMDSFSWMTLPEFLSSSSPAMNSLIKKLAGGHDLSLRWDASWSDIKPSKDFGKKKGSKPK